MKKLIISKKGTQQINCRLPLFCDLRDSTPTGILLRRCRIKVAFQSLVRTRSFCLKVSQKARQNKKLTSSAPDSLSIRSLPHLSSQQILLYYNIPNNAMEILQNFKPLKTYDLYGIIWSR